MWVMEKMEKMGERRVWRGYGVVEGEREGEREGESGKEKVKGKHTAIDNKPGSVCFRSKFSSANVLVP
jgi:hypothetical protein